MGLPYSKQINSAFDQVTPLVAAGFEVLQTTKNVSILLATIQVLTALLLAVIAVTLAALLIAVNPDLDKERRTIVTPVMQWVACWLMPDCKPKGAWWALTSFVVAVLACLGATGWFSMSTNVNEQAPEESEGENGSSGKKEEADSSKKDKPKE